MQRLILIALAANCAAAAPQSSGAEATIYGPYCGIYALFGAGRQLGVDVAIVDLVKPKYISSENGSTLEDLGEAAEDLGLSAVPISGATPRTLRGISSPCVLHWRKDAGRNEYDHYVLYMGAQVDRAGLRGSALPGIPQDNPRCRRTSAYCSSQRRVARRFQRRGLSPLCNRDVGNIAPGTCTFDALSVRSGLPLAEPKGRRSKAIGLGSSQNALSHARKDMRNEDLWSAQARLRFH